MRRSTRDGQPGFSLRIAKLSLMVEQYHTVAAAVNGGASTGSFLGNLRPPGTRAGGQEDGARPLVPTPSCRTTSSGPTPHAHWVPVDGNANGSYSFPPVAAEEGAAETVPQLPSLQAFDTGVAQEYSRCRNLSCSASRRATRLARDLATEVVQREPAHPHLEAAGTAGGGR
jgi:hypothetical protein